MSLPVEDCCREVISVGFRVCQTLCRRRRPAPPAGGETLEGEEGAVLRILPHQRPVPQQLYIPAGPACPGGLSEACKLVNKPPYCNLQCRELLSDLVNRHVSAGGAARRSSESDHLCPALRAAWCRFRTCCATLAHRQPMKELSCWHAATPAPPAGGPRDSVATGGEVGNIALQSGARCSGGLSFALLLVIE